MAPAPDEIIDAIARTRVVPLFTHNHPGEALEVLRHCYAAGIRVFEFTNRSANAFEVFSHLLLHRSLFPDLFLGIGTIMDAATTEKYITAGADFIISPIMKVSMGEVCSAHGVLWIPGCATLTEIVTAQEHGAQMIKIFPASVSGPAFVSSILAVVPNLKLMITGGVEATRDSITEWLSAGAFCMGMGSKLFDRDTIDRKDWHKLEQRVKHVLLFAAEKNR